MTAEQAREAAEGLLLRIRHGEDPAALAKAERAAADFAAVEANEQRFESVLDSYIEL